MNPDEILEIAAHPNVPKFVFGSKELDEWNRAHRHPATCLAVKDSCYYVVIHRSLNPQQRPDFRVLSRWFWNEMLPRSWDVPFKA